MSSNRIHYAGEVFTKRARILRGWAACCSGRRAENIRRDGANTMNPADVTCKACLRVMERATDHEGKPRPIR